MYDEDNVPNETPVEKPMEIKADEKISVKKSTYNNMLKGLIAAVAIAAFFGGLSIGTFDKSDSGLSGEELKDILSEIEIKKEKGICCSLALMARLEVVQSQVVEYGVVLLLHTPKLP